MWQPRWYCKLGRTGKISLLIFFMVAATLFAGTIGKDILQFFLDRYGVVRAFSIGIFVYVLWGFVSESMGFEISKSAGSASWSREISIPKSFLVLLKWIFRWKIGKVFFFGILTAIPFMPGPAGVLAERINYPRNKLFWGSIAFGRVVKGTYFSFLFYTGVSISSLVVQKAVTLFQTIVSHIS